MNPQQTESGAPVEREADGDAGSGQTRRERRRTSLVARAKGAESPRKHTELAELPDPFAPAAVPTPVVVPAPVSGSARGWIRAGYTWQQILGGLILVVGCVVAAVWYVPRVLTTNRSLVTGSVVSSGVLTLNFTSAGQIDRIAVRPGQRVHKGQLLATEYAPNLQPVLSADAAAISADLARLASVRARQQSPHSALPVAAARSRMSAAQARLKLDRARQATDQVRLSASRIVAPAPGTVNAANGHQGETVTAAGIRDYASDSQRAATQQRPAFSLLPEGPQPVGHPASVYALPVVALRTSSSWQVAALVPEKSVSRVSVGQGVTISVPAAHIARIQGRISEILASPVATAQGNQYQALVTVAGHVSRTPLSGMAADVRLDGPARRPSQ